MSNSKSDDLAVLFADIVESTALYRRLGDIEALKIINACLGAMKGVLPQHHGRLVKTLGDAVMCLFPDADSAVDAAVGMQRAISALQPQGLAMRIRVGLHTGPVVVGGDDVYGDTVNVAAYLADAATPDQILIAQTTLEQLEAGRREATWPIFDAILKTSLSKTAVCEVQWRDDLVNRTQINPHIRRVIPEDAGSLVLMLGGIEHRLDHWHPILTVGRDAACELVVTDPVVSRRHATIRVERTQFFLVDHSVNGTFITRDGGEEVHLIRREILLEGGGEIRPGYSRALTGRPVITFRRDRRSIYRF
jgi:adenylate cyclase